MDDFVQSVTAKSDTQEMVSANLGGQQPWAFIRKPYQLRELMKLLRASVNGTRHAINRRVITDGSNVQGDDIAYRKGLRCLHGCANGCRTLYIPQMRIPDRRSEVHLKAN
jgi:hypothetical protein